MFEKLKGFLDLKAIIVIISIIASGYAGYKQIEVHEKRIWSHYNKIQTLDKEDVRIGVRLDAIEARQNSTDAKMDRLNESIQELNRTMVRLSTILEDKFK
ncbi:hypothetical protein [Aeromonas sp. AE23HZ002T15]